MVTGSEDVHHRVLGTDHGDRVETARKRLAENEDIGSDTGVLEGEHLAGTSEARLDLVEHQQDPVLIGDPA